jgi:hypothetical protein
VREAALDYYRRLVDFATEVGGTLVSVHDLVGRIAPIASLDEEEGLLIDGTPARSAPQPRRSRASPTSSSLWRAPGNRAAAT